MTGLVPTSGQVVAHVAQGRDVYTHDVDDGWVPNQGLSDLIRRSVVWWDSPHVPQPNMRLGPVETVVESTGAARITAERHRQVAEEGWTADHDAFLPAGQLARAAACYADHAIAQLQGFPDGPDYPDEGLPVDWPWRSDWWKPSEDSGRNLVRAGALIAAELDRGKAPAAERYRR